MPCLHRRDLLLFAWLMLAGAGMHGASAQEAPMATVPLSAPTMPGTMAEGGPASAPMVAPAGPEFGPSAAPAAPAPGGCTCGDRRGLSRWRWHRKHCKRHLQDNFLGYAEEFNEWPLGEALYAHGRTQVANGQAARMVFNHYDFVDGTSQLNVRGRDKLAAVAARLPTNFFPIVVERTPKEPGLDQSRKSVLLAELSRGPFPVPSERVLIGPNIAYGMAGFEAVNAIYPGQVSNLASGGAIGGAGVTGFVGGGQDFSAGGLSGSAVGSVFGR
jgi:hypothetical protein